MAHPYYHALSSVKKHGGKVEDYLPIHDWFDESKKIIADYRHRALRHHAEGIFMCETIFGTTITNSSGHIVPVRIIGEQHVKEDLGYIPSFADWATAIKPEPWMNKPQKLSRQLAEATMNPRRDHTAEDITMKDEFTTAGPNLRRVDPPIRGVRFTLSPHRITDTFSKERIQQMCGKTPTPLRRALDQKD